MKNNILFSLIVLLLFAQCNGMAQHMNNERLEDVLAQVSDTLVGKSGSWEFSVNGLPMMCITDEVNNRMRIITPVKEMKDVTRDEIADAMEANFHSALDVKYAVSNDLMWVAYIHPLKELSEEQLVSAVSQVYYAHSTFGSTYTSSNLVFPGKGEKEQKSAEKGKKERSEI